jgi:septal ring factor EnvC (AmiA/AmiB activator)
LAKELPRVRYRVIQRLVLFAALCCLAAYLGCATPKPCTVTPVDIEEIKSDIRGLDADLAKEKEVLSKLQAEVADLQVAIAERRGEVPVVQAELERLRKASGRTEKPLEEETATETSAGSGM